MMTDPTIEVLRQIRDGIGELRQDVNQRLDQTNERLDQTNSHLERIERNLDDLDGVMYRIARDQADHEHFCARPVGPRPNPRSLQS